MLPPSSHPGDYMRQLDALRAIAIALVLEWHWVGTWPFTPWMNGPVGVHLFFVISGFLITGILLDAREEGEQAGAARGGILGRFYIRRFLRIFPLFYATLLVGYIAGFPRLRESIWWHVAYASNLFFFKRGSWFGEVSHFWSLAVEEQFYLVWPLVILFAPRRRLVPLLLALIVFATGFRYACQFGLGWNDVRTEVLPFACLDSLAIGGLFAVLQRTRSDARRIARNVGIVALPLWVISAWFADTSLVADAIARPLRAPALVAIVFAAATGISGPLGKLLLWRPFIYLGRISYGLYIFHNFIPLTTTWVLKAAFGLAHVSRYITLPLDTAVLIVISALSWELFESRVNRLKKHFPYVVQKRDAAPFAPVAQPE